MNYTLEEKIGISWEQIKMLAEIATTTGVCITEYQSPNEFYAAYFETQSFDMLYDAYKDLEGKISEKMRDMMRAEMQRRIDAAT